MQNCTIWYSDNVDESSKLSAEQSVVINLEQAEYMFLQLDFKSDEVIDWIQSEKITICATDKNVFLHLLRLEVPYWNCTSNCLVFHGLDLRLSLQWVEIQDINLFVGSITEQKLMSTVLDVDLSHRQTDMLRHLVHKLHLYHAPDFLTLVAHDKLCNLLVTHVGRPVDFRTKLSNFWNAFWLGNFDGTFFDQRQVRANVLEDAKSRSTWRSMPSNFHRLVFESDHRLGKHVCCLLSAKGIERLNCIAWLISLSLQTWLIVASLVLLSFKADNHWIECLHEVFNCVIDTSIGERRSDHCKQVVNDHLRQVKNLGVLLLRVQQVPIKFSCQVSRATNSLQECRHIKQLAYDARWSNCVASSRVSHWLDALFWILERLLAALCVFHALLAILQACSCVSLCRWSPSHIRFDQLFWLL